MLGIYSQDVKLAAADQTPFIPTSFVQIKSRTFAGAGANAAAFNSDNSSGGMIIVHFFVSPQGGFANNSHAIVIVSDTQGNVYTQLGNSGGATVYSFYTGSNSNYNSAVFIALNVKAGPNTVTGSIVSTNGAVISSTTINALEYKSNGGVGATAVGHVAFTGGYPAEIGPVLTTQFKNQKVLYLSASGGGTVPAGGVGHATGVTEFSLPTPITQQYADAIGVGNTNGYAWGVAF